MVETITEDVTKTDLKGVVSKLLPDATAKDIEKASQGIYPLHDVYIRKVSNTVNIIAGKLLFNASLPKLCRNIFYEY